MRKQLLFAFLILSLLSFSARAQVGFTCDNPIEIGSLPYQVLDGTSNYGNTIAGPQSSGCGATPFSTNYLSGNDVIYKFIATQSGNISITMTPGGTRSSIFVYDDCASIGISCLAGVANTNGAPRIINQFAVVAEEDYYIVISSNINTPTIDYNLILQYENCEKPIAIGFDQVNATLTGGNFTWTEAGTATSWELAVQDAGELIPAGAGNYVDNDGVPGIMIDNLQTGHLYQYWVRSVCAAGGFSAWAGPFVFNTLICQPENQCTYTFRMTDSGNNGWNGARMQIRQNGIVLPNSAGQLTLGGNFNSGPGPVDVTVAMCKDLPFDIFWVTAGTQPQQCILSVLNSFGQTIFTKSAGNGFPGEEVFNGLINCTTPVCNIPPTNVAVSDITPLGATINWDAPGTENVGFDIFLQPAGTLAPTFSTMPTFSGVNGSAAPFSYTIQNGLMADTAYDVYVRVNCVPTAVCSPVVTFTTLPTCPKPSNQNLLFGSITTTTAELSWTESGSATQWDVILLVGSDNTTAPGLIPVVNAGDLYFQGLTNTSIVPTLQPATIYSYYVRAVCSEDDKSNWVGPYIFNTITCNLEDKCPYKFILTDSEGNGWNGGRMQVKQNGIVIATIGAAFNTGAGPVTTNVMLCNNVPFEVYWNIQGTAPEEMGVSIINPFQDIIFTKLPGEGTPLTNLFSSVGNCLEPTCPKPSSPYITEGSVSQTSVKLYWYEDGLSQQLEIYIAPVGSALPLNNTSLNTGIPNYYLTEVDEYPFTINGLLPGTDYIYYTRSVCSSTDRSTWNILSPKTFTTLPANDECENAISVPVNLDSEESVFVSGSTLGATASPQVATCSGDEDDDVWFSFVATSTAHLIKINNITGATLDVNHSLFSGECAMMTQLYCSDPNTSVAAGLTVGTIYKIRIYTNVINDNNPINANFDLYITTPPIILNDECTTAINVPVSQSIIDYTTISGTVTGATPSAELNTCEGSDDDDVWYKFVATSNKHLIKFENIQGSSAHLVHSLFAGSDCGNPILLYCSNPHISIAQNLVIGNEYKIRVWSPTNVSQEIIFDLSVSALYASLLANTTQFTNEQLVTNVLVNNPCVDISNITSSTGTNFDSVNGIGYFTNTNPFFPINSGLVLSTGNAANAGGPNLSSLSEGSGVWNTTGDSDLENIIQFATGFPMQSKNATKLEFDFTSQNEFMSFNFLFASEEYGTFQCSYADAFAFLLTDLVTNTTTNLAVVPGTNVPVSVVTIRDTECNPACISQNESFFDTFFDGTLAEIAATNFNGQTALMSASSAIVANRPYHIKMVIADKIDGAYDSAVFIQAGSFSSGPPQCIDKVNLVAFIDANNNGTKEETESSFTYGSFVYQVNNAGDINNISSPIGNYSVYDANPLNSYDFTYQVHPEYAAYFSAGTISHDDITIPTGSGTQTLYFPVTQIQGYNDVTVAIVPVGQPTAGFSYTNKIVYKNLGTAATSGTITYSKDPLVTVSSAESGVVNTTDGFTYNFTNLAPFETRTFNFTINVPPIPAVNIDDVLESSVAVSAPENDINLNNNSFVNSQIVVASYDPNDKMEAHGDKLDFNSFSQDDYLFYTIRFQNTGTANAINIRIEDLLDAQLDEESIRMVSASHSYVMERVGNKVVWKFDYIYLPSHLANEELSNGYLTFKIKVKPGFALGDVIPNSAEIYFDTNPAIITNTFTSTFEEQLAAPEFSSGNLLIYPNPSNGMVYINTQNTTENLKEINLYDVLGKMILSLKNLSSKQSTLNVAPLAKGVYMIEIATENNFKQIKKLVVN